MNNEILKEKIKQAVEILREKDVDMWMIFVRESSNIKDPSMEMVVGTNVTWESAFMICKDRETSAIIGSMELDNINDLGLYGMIEGYLKSIREPLTKYLLHKAPKKIALNFSKNSNLADGLTHGMYLNLAEHLKETPFIERFISSEEIVSALRGRKSETELSLIKEAVKETEKMFDEVSQFIKPGKSEIEIANFLKEKVNKNGWELAWDEDHCPAVFTGPGAGSAHSGPTENKVERGHMVNIDFGIKLNGYCSDLQRTWYVLKEGEDKAPGEVVKGFNIIRDAIQKVADNLKPGVEGCAMDDIARNEITANGYEEYPHGLGHQVGRKVHDGGGGLLPRWERYGNTPFMKVEARQVYTIEPRLTVEGYGTSTLEEMVVVNENGCEFISNPQKEIWIVR